MESTPSDLSQQDMYARFAKAKKIYPDIVDDATIGRYIFMNLFARSDITACVLRTIINSTLKSTSVHFRLREELDTADLSYPVSLKSAQTLPYLDAIVHASFMVQYVGKGTDRDYRWNWLRRRNVGRFELDTFRSNRRSMS